MMRAPLFPGIVFSNQKKRYCSLERKEIYDSDTRKMNTIWIPENNIIDIQNNKDRGGVING